MSHAAPSDSPPPPALHAALSRLRQGQSLDEGEAAAAFGDILAGTASPQAMADLLRGLREKGETAEEIAGAARALRGAMVTIPHPRPDLLVDTCGTGGGKVTTINLSTAAAFVAAAAGALVAKHGNRSFTSRSGSADVVEALGVSIEISPARAATVLDEVGLAFLFAPTYHPAMRHVAPVRQELGTATIMNLVGPLANPAAVGRQVVGVADPVYAPRMAEALRRLGTTHALVVHGVVGVDEIAPHQLTHMWEIQGGVVREWTFDPAELGWGITSLDGLEGGSPEQNATRIVALLKTPKSAPPAFRAAVLLNAGAALYVSGLAGTLIDAVRRAEAALLAGRGFECLQTLRVAAPR